jgi:RHS repeat-associated protein
MRNVMKSDKKMLRFASTSMIEFSKMANTTMLLRSLERSGCALVQTIFVLLVSVCILLFTTNICSAAGGAVSAAPVSPGEARQILNESGMPGTVELTTSETEVTPEIEELARALKHDPKHIYEYVRNHIDYVPTFGSVNGARATLLAGRGNDFDQASLFIALMRASGYTANYVIGDVTYSLSDAAKWLGVDENPNVVEEVLANGGIPVAVDPSGSVQITRVWASVNIDGLGYIFDSAFKHYDRTTGIDLDQALGYNRGGFISAAMAGATIQDGYVQQVNEQNIRSSLQGYSANLVNYIKDNHPNASVRDIIGGWKILPIELDEYPVSLPSSLAITNQTEWIEIPDNYRLKLRIQLSGIDHIFRSFEIAGKRVSISYEQNDLMFRLDGTLLASENNSEGDGGYHLITISVDHPYAAEGGTYCDETNTSYISDADNGGTYVIFCDFESVSKNLIQARNNKKTDQEEIGVLNESLYIMALTWLHEVRLSQALLESLTETTSVTHHIVGFMKEEDNASIIDACLSAGSATSIHDQPLDKIALVAAGSLGSALESAIFDQLQRRPGVSAVKLLQISNANGKKTFYADSSNFLSIQGQLQNYTQSQINIFQSLVDEGNKLILPEDAYINLNEWWGLGWITLTTDDDGIDNGFYFISGGYYGGSSSWGEMYPFGVYGTTSNNYPDLSKMPIDTPTSRDPVNMASGAYVYEHTDLSLGKAEPLGLQFTRSYNSSANSSAYNRDAIRRLSANRGFGYGWTHNYDIYLESHSHGDPGLGGRLPVEAASSIAAAYIAYDIYKSDPQSIDLQVWMIGVLTAKWAMDQLIDNAVTLHMGHKSLEYIKLADGTYNPPPGVTAKLVKEGDNFFIEERFDVTMEFDTNNRISSWQDADGNTLSFTYTEKWLTSVRDALGRTLNLQYLFSEITGFIVSVSDSAGRTVSYDYQDLYGELPILSSYTDSENKVRNYGYDDEFRMVTLTNPLGITTATNTYDSLGRVKTQTVPRQGGADATYNLYFSGFRNIEEDPDGNQTIYYFDDKGRTIGVENALGHKNTMEYDCHNRLIKVTDPRMSSTGFEYDDNHNLTSTIDGLSYVTNYIYDAQFRLTDITDPLGHTTRFGYDSEHHLNRATTYPEIGKEIHIDATYYTNGLEHIITDGDGTATTMTYDAYGNPETSKTGIQPPVTYGYDSIGRMLSLTDQANTTTTFNYDNRGLLLSKTDPLGSTTSFTFYDNERLQTKTDRNNDTISYTYTPSGKLDTITYPDTTTVSFTYDLHDNLVEMHDSLGTTTYAYDEANRLISFTDPHGFIISYDYDKAGNLIELTYPGDKKIRYTYDELNRLKTVTILWLNQTATYAYDEAGRLVGHNNFNGTWGSYSYDNAGRLTDLENRKSDSGVISAYHFTLDDDGNRAQVVKVEPIKPMLSETTIEYTYNDKKNRLLAAGATSFGYDSEGQLSDINDTLYAFDFQHRLVSTGGSSPYQYSYDGMGRRLQAIRNGTTTRYIYDAYGNLLAEADGNNNITRYYIYGKGLMAMVTASDDIYCYHSNAIGSTIAMTDQHQDIVNKYAYTPFGIIADEQEGVAQPFKYVGQFGVMAEPNGFYYMRARYYDPEVGRFITEDPIGFAGGDVNLYAYVQNNPINYTDPYGLLSYDQNRARRKAANTGLMTKGVKTVASMAVGSQVVKSLNKAGLGVTIGTIIKNRGAVATLGAGGTAANLAATALIKGALIGGAFYAGIEAGSNIGAYFDTLVDDGEGFIGLSPKFLESIGFGSGIPNSNPCEK